MSADTIRKPLFGVAVATGLLLLIAGIAMQLTKEVAWGPEDFVAAAALLFSAGAATVLIRRHVKTASCRTLLTMVIALCFLLVWAELAVGLFH